MLGWRDSPDHKRQTGGNESCSWHENLSGVSPCGFKSRRPHHFLYFFHRNPASSNLLSNNDARQRWSKHVSGSSEMPLTCPRGFRIPIIAPANRYLKPSCSPFSVFVIPGFNITTGGFPPSTSNINLVPKPCLPEMRCISSSTNLNASNVACGKWPLSNKSFTSFGRSAWTFLVSKGWVLTYSHL